MTEKQEKPASQDAGKTANQPVDKRKVNCILKMHLSEGREYVNEMMIPFAEFPTFKENLLKTIESALESGKNSGIFAIHGSLHHSMDFSAIPIKSIIFVEMNVRSILPE